MRRPATALALIAASGCGGQSPIAPASQSSALSPVVPSADWPASTPDSQQVNAQAIGALVARIRSGGYGSVSSLLIARHGQLIVEEYFGWSPLRAHTIQSVTKSVTSLVAGTPSIAASSRYATARSASSRTTSRSRASTIVKAQSRFAIC